ncbi:MAG: FmdB family zinc ribbon protein [Myxococcaceae bacterium]
MPIYEYTCSKCNKLSDVLQKLSEKAPERCPACGAEGTLSRVVSRTSFVLKGGGWGADLYASKKADGAATPAAEGTKAADKETPAAPAAASPTSAPAGSSGASATPAAPSSTATKSTKSESDS